MTLPEMLVGESPAESLPNNKTAGQEVERDFLAIAAVEPGKPWKQLIALFWAIFFAGSLVGLAVSLWIHCEALGGIDPAARWPGLRSFQLPLFLILLPLLVDIIRSRHLRGLLFHTRWVRVSFYTLLAYYGANFYVFLYRAAEHLDSAGTWRMFSAGWLLIFTLSAAYYQSRFAEFK